MERVIFKEGKEFNPSFLDDAFPTVMERPDKTASIIVEAVLREGPYGAKGVGRRQ